MNYKNAATFLLIILLLSACKTVMTPWDVSDKFWLGMKTKNIALIKKFALADSVTELNDKNTLPEVESVNFGKIIIDGDFSEVETEVSIVSDNKQFVMNLTTYLQKQNDTWKVDYDKTMLPLTVNKEMAELFGDIQVMSEEFAEEIKGSVEEFKEKALPEIKSKVQEAEKELRKKLPELKNMIDEFLEELEKSIEESMPNEEEVITQET